MNSSSPSLMPFNSWTRKNSIKKKGTEVPFFRPGLSRPRHVAGRRLRRRIALEPGARDRRKAAALHVDLRFLRPAFGRGFHQREHVERLDELVVGLAHLHL